MTKMPCSDCNIKVDGCIDYCRQYHEWKDQGREAKADAGKIRPTLVPTQIIRDIAIVREYGVKKYGDPENWKRVEPDRYRDALLRHILAYVDDPLSTDEESGIPHLWHAACNIAFLCEYERMYTLAREE